MIVHGTYMLFFLDVMFVVDMLLLFWDVFTTGVCPKTNTDFCAVGAILDQNLPACTKTRKKRRK